MRKAFKQAALRALQFPFILIAASVLWLEEWLWAPLGEAMRRLGRLPIIHSIENLIQRAPPIVALACFGLPVLALLPFKVVGLWLLGLGHVLPGVAMFLGAKLVGTALVARIFALTQPALMQLAWFARLSAAFLRTRAYLYRQVRATAAWRAMRVALRRIRRWMRGALWGG